MRWSLAAAVAVFAAALTGCSQDALLHRLAKPQDEAAARNTIELLRQHRLDAIQTQLAPSLQTAEIAGQLAALESRMPAGPVVSSKLVGVHTLKSSAALSTDLAFEYQFPSQWVLFDVLLLTEGSTQSIGGLHLTPLATPLEEQARFGLWHKEPTQYIILSLAVLGSLLSLYASAVCLRTQPLRRRWLWASICLCGVARVSVNWASGAVAFAPFYVSVPPGGGSAQLYSPWTVYASLPVGAVVFLALRGRLRSTPSRRSDGSFEGRQAATRG